VPLSDLHIRYNNGQGIAQQARLSLPLRRRKMAAPPTPPPQHPRVPGRSLLSFLIVIGIIMIYISIPSFTESVPRDASRGICSFHAFVFNK